MVTNPEKLQEQAIGLFRHDVLPDGFAFVERLSSLHQRLFFIELWQAASRYQMTGSKPDLEQLAEVIEGWEATAGVDSDPDVAAQLRSKKRYQPLRIA